MVWDNYYSIQLLTKENTQHGTIKNNDNKAIQSWKVNRFWIKRQMKKYQGTMRAYKNNHNKSEEQIATFKQQLQLIKNTCAIHQHENYEEKH